jgi:hypothetical protein
VAGSHNLFLRAAALLLALSAAGIPLNEPSRLVIFFLAAIWLGAGRLRVGIWNWAAAFAVLAVVTIGAQLLPLPRIQEGHNIFVRISDGEALQRELPAPVFKRMAELFDARYPPAKRCKDNDFCWARSKSGMPDRAFAFSADGAWSHTPWSRVVSGIAFDDFRMLRLGDINLLRYNWGDGDDSDVTRPDAPYFAAWRLTDDLVGSRICWRGETMWGRDQSFASFTNAERNCREIKPEDVGATVFALGIAKNSLAVELEKSPRLQLASNTWLALRLSGVVAIALLLAAPTAETLLVAILAGAGFLALVFYRRAGIVDVHDILTRLPVFYGRDDGLTYEGHGRVMLQHALHGNWAGFLRGGEDVYYYYQPGIRYFRSLEKAIFGETAYFYLLAFSFFPVVLYKLVRYVSAPWLGMFLAVFLFFGIGASFGLDFYAYTYWMLRGFAEPLAYMLFLLAIFYGLQAVDRLSTRDAALCGLLVATAIFLRTNLAIAGVVLLAMLAFHLLFRAPRILVPLASTSALTLLIPLHNIYFGKRLVLLTSVVDNKLTLVMPPWVYARALADIVTGNAGSPSVDQMLAHLNLWLGTERGSVPLHAAALAALLWATISAKTFTVRLLGTVSCALQFTLMFWRPESRFGLLAWLMTVITILAFAWQKFARNAPSSAPAAA